MRLLLNYHNFDDDLNPVSKCAEGRTSGSCPVQCRPHNLKTQGFCLGICFGVFWCLFVCLYGFSPQVFCSKCSPAQGNGLAALLAISWPLTVALLIKLCRNSCQGRFLCQGSHLRVTPAVQTWPEGAVQLLCLLCLKAGRTQDRLLQSLGSQFQADCVTEWVLTCKLSRSGKYVGTVYL